MDLTQRQIAVIGHGRGPVRVTGAGGTGKTTTLLHRFVHLTAAQGAEGTLVLCRNRGAADRFLASVLRIAPVRVGTAEITTFVGMASRLVRRHRGDVRVLSPRENRALVRELLIEEAGLAPARRKALWPTLHGWLSRPALIDEVVGALAAHHAAALPDDEVIRRADEQQVGSRWRELVSFAIRYHAALAERRAIDARTLVPLAGDLLDDESVLEEERTRLDHVIVDDLEAADLPATRLLGRLLAPDASITIAANPDASLAVGDDPGRALLGAFDRHFSPALEVVLDQTFREPRQRRLVICPHPSVEPETVADELIRAHESGVGWSEMAVLTTRPGSSARPVIRALDRHHIPTAATGGSVAGDPMVRGLIDLLRWVVGEPDAAQRVLDSPVCGLHPDQIREIRRDSIAEAKNLSDHPHLASLVALVDELRARSEREDPAALAFDAFRRLMAHLVHDPSEIPSPDPADDHSLDAVVALIDGLSEWVGRHPGGLLRDYLATLADPEDVLGLPSHSRTTTWATDAVTVCPITSAAGREWSHVIIEGCLEGELPHISDRRRFFDPVLLSTPVAPTIARRRRNSLDQQRRLFGIATTRATHTVVTTASPIPGTPASRFVADWPNSESVLPSLPADVNLHRSLSPTGGVGSMWPGGTLHLSASQLEKYADCPLAYAYSYGLRVRTDPGVQADLGSLVHEVLAEFLSPESLGANGGDRSRTRLMAIADERWHDDIARFRPQVEEARRDYREMLDQWWQHEGEGPAAPEVLRVEHRFDVEVGSHRLHGSIDRIDRADDGMGVRIVDYKTGRREPRPEDVEENLQLAIYHLAAKRDPEIRSLGDPTTLRLLFLRTMHALDQVVTPDHERTTSSLVETLAEEILAERFDPSIDADCMWCEFKRLCPLQDEGREVDP